MSNQSKIPEEKRERLRHEELKRTPTGNLNDSFNKANTGSFVDLVGSLGWKGTGILIVVLIVGYVLYKLIFLKYI